MQLAYLPVSPDFDIGRLLDLTNWIISFPALQDNMWVVASL